MMLKKLALASTVLGTLFLAGCASVPMESAQESVRLKAFPAPESNMAGIYVYRDSYMGKAQKKDIYIDSECLGESANHTFFYKQVAGGKNHELSTESEFSDNKISVFTEPGKNYFFRQIIKIGVFVGGAKLEAVPESEGKRVISKVDVQLAKSGVCSN